MKKKKVINIKAIDTSDYLRWFSAIVLIVFMFLGNSLYLYFLVTILIIDSELKTMTKKITAKLKEINKTKIEILNDYGTSLNNMWRGKKR